MGGLKNRVHSFPTFVAWVSLARKPTATQHCWRLRQQVLRVRLEVEDMARSKNHAQGKYGNGNFADGSHKERPRPLFAKVTQVGP